MIRSRYISGLPEFVSEFLGESGSYGINLIDADTEYIIEKPVPGFTKEDITLKLESGGILLKTVSQEKTDDRVYLRRGFDRRPILNERLILPRDITGEGIKARVKDGILEIHVPKSPAGDIEIL